ncbi:XRE family transcriptional regulator [Nitrosospira lacus]|uniref:HTH cro/C1-type domain-containing protein n=1 Tax=Nitrosospira lacus TaxID=1288494 RepID=A0A1W6SN27_9PROT|nr:helix-turn-helix transcriptional regulator [Nitrosospira lacus]ARO87204.1 XRE family transcriptional regulator [Nitrosospira lacus]
MELIKLVPVTVGRDIARFRAEFGATQSQLAAKSGVDQSRISRIENGEAGTDDELERILVALKSLGSKDADDYRAFLVKDWQHVERPDFSNPQRNILELAEEGLRQIAEFLAEERPWPLKRQLERQRAGIEASAAYLGKASHQIAFIGEVGVGKSTAISFLYGLLDPVSSASDLRERVVLETGGGHTTLCEVNIRRGPGFGIVVQAQSDEEMRKLIGDFCAATWLRCTVSDGQKNDSVNVSEEVQRALRNISGLTVKRERDMQGKTTSRDQALELASHCATEEEFRARVIESMNLEQRTRREIWIEDAGGKTAMQQLRKLFRDINNGRLSDVPLPASIDLLIPGFGLELPGMTISVVDTKGLDEVAVRADLDARLKDSRTHVVLCSTFNQAPSTSVQLLLNHLRNAHGIHVGGGKVSVLALPRDNEAMAVKDDTGEPPIDDKDGYDLKRDQITRTLVGADGALSEVPILFFNAKKDDAARVREQLLEQIVWLRKSYEERLLDECAAADEVVRNHETQAFSAAVQEVAARLAHFLDAHTSLPPRIRQPSQELIDAMSKIRYASTIWAMTRRNGEYYNFSVSHQVGAGGARDALLRSKTWFDKLQGVLDTLKQDSDLMLAQKTIQQVEASADGWRRTFAESARTAAVEIYRGPLEADEELWSKCANQWGGGPGFKDRVARIIRDWFDARIELNQKLEGVMAALWEEAVVRPVGRLSDESAGDLPKNSGE